MQFFGLYHVDIGHRSNHIKLIVFLFYYSAIYLQFSILLCFLSITTSETGIGKKKSNLIVICTMFLYHMKMRKHVIYLTTRNLAGRLDTCYSYFSHSREFASASRNAASSFLFSNPSKGLLRLQNVNEAPASNIKCMHVHTIKALISQ